MKWSLTEYNLIVYGNHDNAIFSSPSGIATFPAERLFEYTSSELSDRYQTDLSSLEELPALVVAELGYSDRTPAFVGRVLGVEQIGRDVQFQFQKLFDELTSEEVFNGGHFNIRFYESSRTHWAVRQGNLIEGLFRLLRERSGDERPRLFNVEQWPLPILDHIAVMMPFAKEFDPVYEAIKSVCQSQRLDTLRVDEIYGPTQIMDDVFSTIAQSKLVISDLTGRNPNVLYETGLAHALSRDVIMIVQDNRDVPFDLGHIRHIPYLPNQEGLERLKESLSESIQAAGN